MAFKQSDIKFVWFCGLNQIKLYELGLSSINLQPIISVELTYCLISLEFHLYYKYLHLVTHSTFRNMNIWKITVRFITNNRTTDLTGRQFLLWFSVTRVLSIQMAGYKTWAVSYLHLGQYLHSVDMQVPRSRNWRGSLVPLSIGNPGEEWCNLFTGHSVSLYSMFLRLSKLPRIPGCYFTTVSMSYTSSHQ